MKQIIRAYLFLSRKPVTIISMCVTAVLTIALWKLEAVIDPSGNGMIGLQLAFTIEQARTILSSWSDGGADLFLRMSWLYYLNAVSSTVLLASAPGYFARQRSGFNPGTVPSRDVLFILVPFAACLCDWAVQSMMVAILSGEGTGAMIISALAAAAIAKWVLLAFCLVILMKSYFTTRKEKRQARP
jgi:hypothetical protein